MSDDCPVIPRVVACHALPGTCRLSRGLALDPVSGDGLAPPVRQAVRRLITAFGLSVDPIASVRLRFEDRPALDRADPVGYSGPYVTTEAGTEENPRSPEAYALKITADEIIVTAEDDRGRFYAIQTLKQLIDDADRRGGVNLACVCIEDRPRFVWRGSMIDSARHMPSVDWIKRHLDRMADLKLNRFHWHLCDDHAWRAEIHRYPQLAERAAWRIQDGTPYGGVYTQAQMREVVEYGAQRYITVIPEIEMPGHCNAALVAMPELSCTGEPWPIPEAGGWKSFLEAGRRPFCAAKPEVYEFLGHVLEEIDEVFDTPYLHIGGDETPREKWDQCPACQNTMRDHGLADSTALRVHFLNRVHEICRDRLGKTTIAWTEGVSGDLPPDQIVHAWFPGEAAAAARLSRDVINSNQEWTYLDYPRNGFEARDKPDWMLVLPFEKVYHFDPLPDGLEAAYAHHVLGSESPLWTEHTREEATMDDQLMPRLAAFAEAMWSPRVGQDFEGFRRRLNAQQVQP